jgi:subtilase family serine protease
LYLQLRRSSEQEQALAQFIDQLHDPSSPNFHKWITPLEFEQRFGLADQDLRTIAGWLRSHGSSINFAYPNGVIDFSGTAGMVQTAAGLLVPSRRRLGFH